jgi:AbiTii-like protein
VPEENEHIKDEVQLRDGVGAIEALAEQPEIKLAPPMATDLCAYMNATGGNPYQQITHLYWGVSPPALRGVVDQIRTALTQLVAELRANMGGDEDIPSAETANQAVQVVVTGERPHVNVTTAQTSGSDAPALATTSNPESQSDDSGFWTRWRKIGAFVVGCATVAGAAFGLVQLLG